MNPVPASRVLKVIASCTRPEQVNVAQLYAVRWCRLTGHDHGSQASMLLFRYSTRKMFELLRGPGREHLNAALYEKPRSREREQKGKDSQE